MSVFMLGLSCGVLLMLAIVWIIGSDDSERPVPVSPRQNIHEIERQAIREMVATAMVNGRISKGPTADNTAARSKRDTS